MTHFSTAEIMIPQISPSQSSDGEYLENENIVVLPDVEMTANLRMFAEIERDSDVRGFAAQEEQNTIENIDAIDQGVEGGDIENENIRVMPDAEMTANLRLFAEIDRESELNARETAVAENERYVNLQIEAIDRLAKSLARKHEKLKAKERGLRQREATLEQREAALQISKTVM